MPIATGNTSRRHSIAKNVAKAATAHPAIDEQRHGRRRFGDREVPADRHKPEQAASADQEHDDAGIGKARNSQRDARASEVDSAIEDMCAGD